MTLDEAIKRAEEEADYHDRIKQIKAVTLEECICAKEHRQLAEWLRELKALREQTTWVPVNKKPPKNNGWYQCTVIVNALPRTMELFYRNGKWLDNRRIDMFNVYDIYGYGCAKEKHKLSYQELISELDWTEHVTAYMPLSEPHEAENKKAGKYESQNIFPG